MKKSRRNHNNNLTENYSHSAENPTGFSALLLYSGAVNAFVYELLRMEANDK